MIRHIVGVDRDLVTELCVQCYEKISRRDAVVMVTEGDADPGPYHVDCFEDVHGITIKSYTQPQETGR